MEYKRTEFFSSVLLLLLSRKDKLSNKLVRNESGSRGAENSLFTYEVYFVYG